MTIRSPLNHSHYFSICSSQTEKREEEEEEAANTRKERGEKWRTNCGDMETRKEGRKT